MSCDMTCTCCEQAFLNQLRKCYFPPVRDNEYRSLTYKTLAFAAMFRLWNRPSILLFGKKYDRREIRSVILFRMTPAHLDRALDVFARSGELNDASQLAELIFATLIYDDTLTEIQYDKDTGGDA